MSKKKIVGIIFGGLIVIIITMFGATALTLGIIDNSNKLDYCATTFDDMANGDVMAPVYLIENGCFAIQDQWKSRSVHFESMKQRGDLDGMKQAEKNILYNTDPKNREEIIKRQQNEEQQLVQAYKDGKLQIGSYDWGSAFSHQIKPMEGNNEGMRNILSLVLVDKEKLSSSELLTDDGKRVLSFEKIIRHKIAVIEAKNLQQLRGEERTEYLDELLGENFKVTDSDWYTASWIVNNGIYPDCDGLYLKYNLMNDFGNQFQELGDEKEAAKWLLLANGAHQQYDSCK